MLCTLFSSNMTKSGPMDGCSATGRYAWHRDAKLRQGGIELRGARVDQQQTGYPDALGLFTRRMSAVGVEEGA
jgi:hypothetical protein